MKHIFIALLFAAIIQACQTSTKESNLNESPIVYASPEEVGMSSDSLELIKKHIQWAIDSQFMMHLVIATGKKQIH